METVIINPKKIPNIDMAMLCAVGLEEVKKAFSDPEYRAAFEQWKADRF